MLGLGGGHRRDCFRDYPSIISTPPGSGFTGLSRGLLFISTKLWHNNAAYLLHGLLRCWLNKTLSHLWRTGVHFLLDPEFPETSPSQISDDHETIKWAAVHLHSLRISSPKNDNCVIVRSTFFFCKTQQLGKWWKHTVPGAVRFKKVRKNTNK